MGAAIARDAPPALQALVSALLRTRLELVLAGLDGSGKSTLCALLQQAGAGGEHAGGPGGPLPPTIGVVVQRARHRGVDLVLWDLGGHQRFRQDWKRHARGCGALVFVVDCADAARLPEARQALQRLLEDPIVNGLPLLVLANKVDLLPPTERACEEVRGWSAMAEELSLDCSGTQRWSVLGVSATRQTNLDKLLRWLVLQAHGAAADGPAGATEGAAGDAAHGGGGSAARRASLAASRLWESIVGRARGSRWRGRYKSVGLATSLIEAEAG